MALSYQQSGSLMQNGDFMNRIKVACLRYATYRGKGAWASSVFQNPQQQAQLLQPIVVMDPNVQSSSAGDGSDVDDGTLQTAVEDAVNNML